MMGKETESNRPRMYCKKHGRYTYKIIGCVETGVAFKCCPPEWDKDCGHVVIREYRKGELCHKQS